MSDRLEDWLRSTSKWLDAGPVPPGLTLRACALFRQGGHRTRTVGALLHDSRAAAPLAAVRSDASSDPQSTTLVYETPSGHLVVDVVVGSDGRRSLDVEYLGEGLPSSAALSAHDGVVPVDAHGRVSFGGVRVGVHVLTLSFDSHDLVALVDLLDPGDAVQ